MWTSLEIVLWGNSKPSLSGYQQFSSRESAVVAQSTHKPQPWISDTSSIQKKLQGSANQPEEAGGNHFSHK